MAGNQQDITFGNKLQDDKYFFNVAQSQGGIFNLPIKHYDPDGTVHEVRGIATYGCRTCVEVCFPISETQCFAAHIDGQLHADNEDHRWIPPTEDAGRQLKGSVKARLRMLFPSGLKDPETSKKNAAIVCSRPYLDQERATGWYIATAFFDFLGVDYKINGAINGAINGHGFLVDLREGGVMNARPKILTWGGKIPTEYDWRERTEKAFWEDYEEELPQQSGWAAVNGFPWQPWWDERGKRWVWDWRVGWPSGR